MTDTQPSSGRQWRYRFSQPGGSELDTRELDGDPTAEACARELSKSNDTPVIVHRYEHLVDDWTYITEVDERS